MRGARYVHNTRTWIPSCTTKFSSSRLDSHTNHSRSTLNEQFTPNNNVNNTVRLFSRNEKRTRKLPKNERDCDLNVIMVHVLIFGLLVVRSTSSVSWCCWWCWYLFILRFLGTTHPPHPHYYHLLLSLLNASVTKTGSFPFSVFSIFIFVSLSSRIRVFVISNHFSACGPLFDRVLKRSIRLCTFHCLQLTWVSDTNVQCNGYGFNV